MPSPAPASPSCSSRNQADGSITANGSTLIGQNWSSPKFFHGRPDDTGPYAANPKQNVSGGDNPLVANGVSGESAATNLGPARRRSWLTPRPWWPTGTSRCQSDAGPGDHLGQRLRPGHLGPGRVVQIPMVAKATGLSPKVLRALIAKESNSAELGFLGRVTSTCSS